ncbi:dolichyl-phosphate-mannose-protein mannosyltransferase [Roseiarcus fermentans]|uniref:Polyprenol-phosphate-mannose--protein mannosyltransferase n=1 Tax=Roseiarcus fermentans TaxID=1473586 RepID=A0A366FQB4_9HYPH|nr:phospholipid carrier-dependent glycosyltransferase [Roseiarcus fermentans]RBP16842.1 dolichyl-phosphate-mannose-protein mannosyltransferase [Roseiarcus fermentans]
MKLTQWKRLAAAAAAVFLLSLAAFLPDIGDPATLTFDETWYVPTARDWLAGAAMGHQEHPPLGKLLIALGMWLAGDNPTGWRAMSAAFGAATVTAVFFWGFGLTGKIGRALWAAALTFFAGAVFVQARIATLDIFLMAFCALALAFFTFSIKATSRSRSIAFALAMGVSLGLAGACKWSGFFLLFGLASVYLLIGLLRTWGVRFSDPKPSDFFSEAAWPGMSPSVAVAAFIAVPLAAYFVAYLPQIVRAGDLYEFVASHERMRDIMSGSSPSHPYASRWFTWLWMGRPVWYSFALRGPNWGPDAPASAIVALVNPVVLVLGEAAVVLALTRWLRFRDRDGLIVTVAFFSQFLPWALDPKGLEFFYYYFPATLAFGPALALGIFQGEDRRRRVVAAAVLIGAAAAFAFFLPVYAGGIGVTPASLAARLWFKSWI